MNYQEMKEYIDGLAPIQRQALSKMLSLSALGGSFKSEFRVYAEEADSPCSFFDAIYADDNLRFTSVWAAWARHTGKDWLGRFEPIARGARIDFRGRESKDAAFSVRGVPVEFAGGGCLLCPCRGVVLKYMYLLTSASMRMPRRTLRRFRVISPVLALSLSGMFDVFRADGCLILEQWSLCENRFSRPHHRSSQHSRALLVCIRFCMRGAACLNLFSRAKARTHSQVLLGPAKAGPNSTWRLGEEKCKGACGQT